MYASNEDEFKCEEKEWVILPPTAPAPMTVLDDEFSSESSSSASLRRASVSSASSFELDQVQPTSHLLDDSVPSESTDEQGVEHESTPIINEYDLPSGGSDLSSEPLSALNQLRRRIAVETDETAVDSIQELSTPDTEPPPTASSSTGHRMNRTTIVCAILLLLYTFSRVVSLHLARATNDRLSEALKDTNQRLDELRSFQAQEIEERLLKQFENKFQAMVDQQKATFNDEKASYKSELNALYQVLNGTRQNLTSSIDQLADENQRLREQITALKPRPKMSDKPVPDAQEPKISPDDANCSRADSATYLTHLVKQTHSLAEDTSKNLSNLFEQLSASLSGLIDHRRDGVEESSKALPDRAHASTTEHIQSTLRRGVKKLSSSIHNVKLNYATWIRARAEQREQARTEVNEQEHAGGKVQGPWRWTFQRGHDRERMRHQPAMTRKPAPNKERVCYSKYEFPVHQLCSMKHWMNKYF